MALVSSAFLAGIFGLLRSFSTSYIMFVIFEFLEPAFGSGVFSSAFILGKNIFLIIVKLVHMFSSVFANDDKADDDGERKVIAGGY